MFFRCGHCTNLLTESYRFFPIFEPNDPDKIDHHRGVPHSGQAGFLVDKQCNPGCKQPGRSIREPWIPRGTRRI
jgi:hypothetical protein